MTLIGKVDSYTIIYPGGGKTRLNFKATIELFDQKENMMGVLYFYLDPGNLPSSDKKENEVILAYFKDGEYERVLDLLREDESIYLHFIDEKQIAVLSTSKEHVGKHFEKI